MPTEQSESFADNWAYLKMELRWLDQILMLAVARQRKETQELDRVTHARADRVTSSWWKGIISTEGKAVYDEHRQPSTAVKVTYQQQLESKIQSSHGQGVLLALPSLRDRLGLTGFEKNLVLMSLAPEINRRYARLYRYLQGDEATPKTDLPTLDLVLRLLCRNDVEWREARHRLVTTSPLMQHRLLHFSPQLSDSLLNCPLKLTEPLVNYLLAGHPTQAELETLLNSTQDSSQDSILKSNMDSALPLPRSTSLQRTDSAVDWSDLVLPASLLSSLQALSQRIQGQVEAEARWGFQLDRLPQGSIALLVGAAGTGKTMAAAAITHSLETALYSLDLRLIDPADYPQVLQDITTQAPTVLYLKSADLWLGRSSPLAPHLLHQFWAQRQQIRGITLLSVCRPTAIQHQWRQQTDQILVFSLPDQSDRLKLWQKAFPAEVPLSSEIDWDTLATLKLNGGEIQTIAQAAILGAAATTVEQVEMQHLVQVLAQQGRSLPRTTVSCKTTAIEKKPRKPRAATNRSEPVEIAAPLPSASITSAKSSNPSPQEQAKKRKQAS